MTRREFERRMEDIRERNLQKQYRAALRSEEKKGRLKARTETSKFLAFYLFALLNGILAYAMAAMWIFQDLSCLGVLVTDIAAQVIVYLIYCVKAFKAKREEEEMAYKRDREGLSSSDDTNGNDTGCAVG